MMTVKINHIKRVLLKVWRGLGYGWTRQLPDADGKCEYVEEESQTADKGWSSDSEIDRRVKKFSPLNS
jgi:hypothetical protein